MCIKESENYPHRVYLCKSQVFASVSVIRSVDLKTEATFYYTTIHKHFILFLQGQHDIYKTPVYVYIAIM